MTPAIGRLSVVAFAPRVVMLTGASGYVGTLIAARLLADGLPKLVVPLRAGTSREALGARLDLELAPLGLNWSQVAARVHTLSWQGVAEIDNQDWAAALDPLGIEEIIHCAGCLDYFDIDALKAVNIDLTRWLIELGGRWGVSRFTYVSTAYSAGYVSGEIQEELLPEPSADPTSYTLTKRQAEWLVAESGLPWLILRPSILIGDWQSGRYSGKRYGLYQQWMGLERLLGDRYHPEIHTVAPRQPLNLLHQDSFQAAFSHAHRWLPAGAIFNMVSDNGVAPSIRELWDMWIEVVRPQRVYYYARFEDIDLRAINIRQRAYLTFAQVNLEIGAHAWWFARGWMNVLVRRGLSFENATCVSVARCQTRFLESSDTMARFRTQFAQQFPNHTEVREAQHERVGIPA